MPLFKDGKFIDDIWHALRDDETIPVDRAVLLPFSRFAGDDGEYCFHAGCHLGAEISPADRVEDIAHWVGKLKLIVLNLPAFSDGRAYSQARVLRERMGYEGELRARGDVLIDQYAFLQQCGFDAFEIPADADIDAWQRKAEEIAVRYQHDLRAGPGMSVLQARHRQRLARAA